MKFSTPGKKVKQTRKYLKITQEELQDKYISRGLISMIETDKRTLTNDVATKLVKKFKQKASELDINLEIDENFLLRSPSEDAEIYCLKKLEDSNLYNNIDEIFEIACKFNLPKVKATFYSKKADFCLAKKDYDNAFINYNKAMITYQDIKQYEMFPYLYSKIGLCKAEACQYKDALLYFNICQNYLIMYKNVQIQQKVLYDKALCYKKINKIDSALECIDKYLLSSNNKEDNVYFYANILKANCYESIGKYDAAIDIYDDICANLSESNYPLLGYVYNNLGLAYLSKLDFKTSLKYFDMSENIRSSADKQNLCHTLIEKSQIFIKQHLYVKAIEMIKSGLKYANGYNDYEYLLKGNYCLINIYEIMNNISNLKEVYLRIADILKTKNNFSELTSVYIKLSLIYLNENDIENAKRCLTLSQNLNTQAES